MKPYLLKNIPHFTAFDTKIRGINIRNSVKKTCKTKKVLTVLKGKIRHLPKNNNKRGAIF